MKLDHPSLHRLAGLLGAAAVSGWMRTLDYKVAYYDPTIDPVYPECRGQKLYIFWHEYILFPLYLRGHCNMTMLLSRHRDAEVLAQAARYLGFQFLRGSTNRGGLKALRELLRHGRETNFAITPDGPRGPRRRLAPGAIYVASRLGLPLVAMGFGYDRPWRVRSAWDRFAIPRPFSRARAVTSPPLHIPEDLNRQGIEHFRRRVESLLNHLTAEAERWAAGGYSILGQRRLYRCGAGQGRLALGRLPADGIAAQAPGASIVAGAPQVRAADGSLPALCPVLYPADCLDQLQAPAVRQ